MITNNSIYYYFNSGFVVIKQVTLNLFAEMYAVTYPNLTVSQQFEITSQTLSSNHFQDMMLRLDDDRKTSTKYCDVTLIVDEYEYPAHKCIFGLLSPFFNKMFSIEMKERRDNKAVIKGVTKEVFEAILDLIYTGSITLNMENVFGIIEAAHYMDLPYVKECCTAYLGDRVTTENWLSLKAYGERYGYEQLLEKVTQSMSEKFTAVVKTKNFVELDVEELKFLLGLENKNIESEEKVYEAVISWTKMDVVGREKHVEELLGFVKFPNMSLDYLNQVVAKEKLIEVSHVCMKSVLQAIGNYKPRLATTALPTTSSLKSSNSLSLKNFLAVDYKTVWKQTTVGLQKTLLQHDYRGGSAVLWRGCVYVFGGCGTKVTEVISASNLQNAQYRGDIPTNKFRYMAAAVVNENIPYVTGGFSSEASAEKLICSYGSYSIWNLFGNCNFNRHSHALASLCDAIYAIGGSAKRQESLLRFNVQTKEINVLSPMKFPCLNLAAVVFKDEIYAIGGNSRYVEKYHPLRNEWDYVASLNMARNRPGACVLGDHIVVVGGGSSAVEVYDEKKNIWTIVGKCEELKDVFAIFPC